MLSEVFGIFSGVLELFPWCLFKGFERFFFWGGEIFSG